MIRCKCHYWDMKCETTLILPALFIVEKPLYFMLVSSPTYVSLFCLILRLAIIAPFMPTIDLDSDNRILKKIILEVLSIMAYHSEDCHRAFLDALLLYKVGQCQRCVRVYG